MKSRTSFFNLTVLKKDITRFAPAWGLYLTGMLLLMLSLFSGEDYRLAADLGLTINILSVVNLGYALVCAALLFGDLFNARLCNALHAMPLRREGWFVTHLISGLLFSVVPNLIVGLCLMPRLGVYWFVALIWVGGLTASYLFFFGAAVISAMCTGSRFAMTLIYGLINFLSILVMWVVNYLYIPLMYGIEIDPEVFVFLSPVSHLCSHELNYLNSLDKIYNYYNPNNGWPYTIGIAVVGAAMLAGSLLLYRKRHLESAGDFITVRFLSPVFLVLYTLAVGIVLFIFSSVFYIDRDYLFLAVGVAVGFITGHMLLKRTVKVFKPATMIGLAVMMAVLFGSLGLARLDVLGLVRWVPEKADVASVSIRYDYDDYHYTAREQTEIEELMRIHEKILEERPEANYRSSEVFLTYQLKDGSTVTRRYPMNYDISVVRELSTWLSRPEYVLRSDNIESLKDVIDYIDVHWYDDSTNFGIVGAETKGLLDAVIADCEAGNMVQDWEYHEGYHSEEIVAYLSVEGPGRMNVTINVWASAINTIQWLKEHLDF